MTKRFRVTPTKELKRVSQIIKGLWTKEESELERKKVGSHEKRLSRERKIAENWKQQGALQEFS